MNSGDSNDWTGGAITLRKSAWVGSSAVLMFAAITFPLAWYFPPLVLNPLLRAFGAFVLAWVLLAVAQRSSGIVGWQITAVAIVASVLVLLSHHVAFVFHGVPSLRGPNGAPTMFEGWGWFSASALVATNATAAIGLAAAAVLGHRGTTLEVILDIFNQRVR